MLRPQPAPWQLSSRSTREVPPSHTRSMELGTQPLKFTGCFYCTDACSSNTVPKYLCLLFSSPQSRSNFHSKPTPPEF